MSTAPTPLSDIIANRLCTGCGGCAAASLNQLVMAETRDESHRPKGVQLNNTKGFASPAAICPGKSVIGPRTALPAQDKKLADAFGPILAVYEGYASEDEVRQRGSSGGVVTALGHAALEMGVAGGVLHAKANRSDPSRSVATVSRSLTQLMEGAGSRYQPVAVLEPMAKPEVLNHQTMLVGKPCDIEGAQRLAVANPAIASSLAMTVSIFCAGTPSIEGTNSLLEALAPDKADHEPALTKLSFRGGGWPGPMRATWRYAGGQKIYHKDTDYSTGWGSILQRFRQWRCHLCSDHTGELADISVGDPWHTPQEDGSKGKSLILTRTERGRYFFEQAIAQGFITATPVDHDTVAKAQPNLMHAKAAAWGRSLALKTIGIQAPDLRADGRRLWLRLPLKAKMQSILGTWKRVWQRKLYQPKSPVWTKSG